MIMDLPPAQLSSPFVAPQAEREASLLTGLNLLTAWHAARCPGYAALLAGVYGANVRAESLAHVPYLPVRMFKHFELRSVPDEAVVRCLTSSGTTGQQVSRIFLDAQTSGLQVRALAAIVQDFIGKQRLPMLIVDQHEIVRGGRADFSARAAGVLGFSNFGRHHFYALDEHMQPRWNEIAQFLDTHRGTPILLFGFTWVIWQYFLQAAIRDDRRFDLGESSILVHGGGWKKLADQSVDNPTFKAMLAEQFGIRRVSNYYGMVEQVGSVFMECETGHFHAPAFADVLMRDFTTLQPSESGAVEVVSLLPRSYPGHAILTEDMGTVLGTDDCPCGRKGKYFQIHGRIPKAEIRGCSDVRAT
ncbi:hypothetical protein R69927_00137 [Paraburkholderia domus]|nr:hypothetical protein R69927_00137 [Paraburkholderia domus]